MPTLSRRLRLLRRFFTSCQISSSGWAVPQPRSRNACWLPHATGLACSLFAHHYSGNRGCFLFLWVLRCFTSPRYLHLPYVFRQGRWAITLHQVSPFGNPRIKVWLPTTRGLSQAPTSFIGSWCQGIHRAPLLTWRLHRCSRPLCSSQGTGGPGLAAPCRRVQPVRSEGCHPRGRSLRTQQRARPAYPRESVPSAGWRRRRY